MKTERIIKSETIKKQDYISADDLMKIIPNLTYLNALKYIKTAQEEMKKKNYYIPTTKPKVALTKIVRELFGFWERRIKMKKTILNICGIIIGIIFATMPITMIVSYFTYTEKIIMPILLIVMLICSLPITVDYIKSK